MNAALGATVLVLALAGAIAILARLGRFTSAVGRGVGRWYSSRAFARERREVKSKEQLLSLALTNMQTLAHCVEDLKLELARERERRLAGGPEDLRRALGGGS